VEFLNYPVIALLVVRIQLQALGEAMAYGRETAGSRKERPGATGKSAEPFRSDNTLTGVQTRACQ
jgi:hypothetical protein